METHIEHIEDLIFTDRFPQVQHLLYGALFQYPDVTATSKWDGSPAFLIGKHPKTGQFFVSTKSGLFSKRPRVCYSPEDVYRHFDETDGDLDRCLLNAFRAYKDMQLETILQADLMYTLDNVKPISTSNGYFLSWKQNHLTYAVPSTCAMAKRILTHQMGAVFHTEWVGTEIESLRPVMNSPTLVSMRGRDTRYGMSESAFLCAGDIAAMVSCAESVKEPMCKARGYYTLIREFISGLTNTTRAFLTLFCNADGRNGQFCKGEPSHSVEKLILFLTDRAVIDMDKLSTLDGKANVIRRALQMRNDIKDNRKNFETLFQIIHLINQAKLQILRSVKFPPVKVLNGAHEGIVISTPLYAAKLVDRNVFTRSLFEGRK